MRSWRVNETNMSNKIKAKTVEQVIEEIRLKVEDYSGKKMSIDEQGEWFDFLNDMADELHRRFTKDTLEMIPKIKFK